MMQIGYSTFKKGIDSILNLISKRTKGLITSDNVAAQVVDPISKVASKTIVRTAANVLVQVEFKEDGSRVLTNLDGSPFGGVFS